MRKPKKLYRFDLNKSLREHEVGPTCKPTAIRHAEGSGVLYQCWHSDYESAYGYSTFREARAEEMKGAQLRIEAEKSWLAKLARAEKADKRRRSA